MFQEIFLTFLLSALPIVELRGAIPLGIVIYGLPVWLTFVITILGNILPAFFLIPLIGKVDGFLSRHSALWQRVFTKILDRTRDNHVKKFELLKEFALVLLVAIPLPLTGVWTASLAAYIFGIPFKKALPLIFVGLLISAVLVTLATIGVLTFIS
ncbi:MAG: small multi-drug export protein [Parcubacteria group bacterium]